jgi:hypothetical protein
MDKIMTLSQLTLRRKMAYGIACFVAYLTQNNIGLEQHKAEINVLSEFSSSENPAEWDEKAKNIIYTKYSDDKLSETIPSICDKLYWIGGSELYGQPSDCKESENILKELIKILQKNNAKPPDIKAFSAYRLINPKSTDDYFGKPFS